MPKLNPLATWNPDRDCWETEVVDIFGHSDVFSETWPTCGMTRNGVAYALPTWEPPTSGSASSSSPPAKTFRTPAAAEAEGGPRNRNRPGATMRLSDQVREEMEDGNLRVFKTPTSQLAVNGGSQHPDNRRAGGHGPTLADEVEHLLPTPVTQPDTGNGHAWNLGKEAQKIATRTGDPTPPPSTAGNPSWEDVPLPLPCSPTEESTACPPASRNG